MFVVPCLRLSPRLAQPTFGLTKSSFALAQPLLSQYTFGLP